MVIVPHPDTAYQQKAIPAKRLDSMKLRRPAITEPFDAEAIVERRVLDLAFLIYKQDLAVEHGTDGSARLMGKRGNASRVVGAVPTALALDAQALLHRFDPEHYPCPHTLTPLAS